MLVVSLVDHSPMMVVYIDHGRAPTWMLRLVHGYELYKVAEPTPNRPCLLAMHIHTPVVLHSVHYYSYIGQA